MFGYITADSTKLSQAEKERYKEYYCGLCHQLGARYGFAGRASLSCDMTFLALLLSSLYDLPEECGTLHCTANPLKWRPYTQTEATAYAADMNVILAYYQALDDWNDDRNLAARKKSKALEGFLPGIRASHPRQCAAIDACLKRLGEMERAGELNPDLPANCFGDLMGEIVVWREDTCAPALYRLGASLGRFVYLMDAVNDLRADIKKQRYNPLVAQMEADYTPMLTMIMGECTSEFEKLPLKRDKNILGNHLYSGVWQKYRTRGRRGEA